MLIHREVAMHTNENGKKSVFLCICVKEEESMYVCICVCFLCMHVCWTLVGAGVRGGGPPKRKMNSSGRG